MRRAARVKGASGLSAHNIQAVIGPAAGAVAPAAVDPDLQGMEFRQPMPPAPEMAMPMFVTAMATVMVLSPFRVRWAILGSFRARVAPPPGRVLECDQFEWDHLNYE